MDPITFPLQPGLQSAAVADLQDALVLLVERNFIQSLAAPNRPTADELQTLTQKIRQERVQSTFGDNTRQLVGYFQNQQHLGDQLQGIVETKTAAAINAALTKLGVLTAPPAFVVSGRVYSAERAGVGGLQIQVVDKNAGPDVVLGEGITDDAGRYTLSYPTAKIADQGKSAPDIQVRALSAQTFLGASEVRYDAASSETLDVVLPATASAALLAEHTTLTDAIAKHFTGRLADLQESGDPAGRQDISYLANKTGWDARAVALAALADQFSARTVAPTGAAPAVAPALFYALFRSGVPADEDILYRTDTATLTAIWTQAAEQGFIPSALTSSLAEAAKQFQALGAQRMLTQPALAGVSSLKELLTTSGLTDVQQQQFATLYTANRDDMTALWKAVGDASGADTAARLQLDGKLGFLTLNNAPLMQVLRAPAGNAALTDLLQLAQTGYHRPDKWMTLLNAATPVPNEIPGDTPEARKTNYAAFLAAQVRLSYPTAAVADMVKSGDLPVSAPDQVHAFLTGNQGKFDIGAQPVERYVASNQLQVAPDTIAQIKRLQRVYQIAPSDQAMSGLLKRGMDAAYHVVRLDKETFVRDLSQDLGGADQAALVYDKARNTYNLTLNIATSYLAARNGIPLGAAPMPSGVQGTPAGGQVLQPAPAGVAAGDSTSVIAYPTLEGLFGSMDFCACDHCRSVLSPAAYLVELLHFIDRDPTPDEANAGKRNPQAVLLERRPDLQHLPLTCENTNTALPYIDVVNETLEYFVANDVQRLSLKDYSGHDTDGAHTEDLLASPPFVMDAAYTILRDERFPPPLPFHRPLDTLRALFNKFEVPLPLAMERLRKSNDLERGANPYGWRDILMEQLMLSREEHEILTDSTAVPLARMYGFPAGTADSDVIAALSMAGAYSRRVGVSYEELVALLQTRFINPNSDLLAKLAHLGVPFAQLQALHDGVITDLTLPGGAATPDPAQYGGDIKAWVKNADNFARIMAIITLVDPASGAPGCNFDALELRYSKPMSGASDITTRLGVTEFVRLLRFIRLREKTGWTIEQTDATLCALFRTDLAPLTPADIDTVSKLDAGFLILLPRLGIVVRAMSALGTSADHALVPLLACWSDIGTQGEQALYRQMFLNPAVLAQDAAFADDGYGNFLKDANQKLLIHAEVLRAAFSLTAEELARIAAALGFDASTSLTLANISAIYRRGWLARKLRLSVREFLLLSGLTGLDPFVLADPARPAITRLIALVAAMKDRSLKSAAALYLIWNQDLSGKSALDPARVVELARTLRTDFVGVDDQFAITEDPAGDVARARMALVYGQEAADSFFSLLENTVAFDVPYTHAASALEAAIIAADSSIAYDDIRHRLSHVGRLSSVARDALKAVPGVSPAFQSAVDGLFARSEDISGSFFTRHGELQPLYDMYVGSADPIEKKRSALLAAFQPELAARRRRQQSLQRLSAAASVDLSFAQILLDPATTPYPLHAAGKANQPALDDVIALEAQGLAAQFFFRDTASGAVDLSVPAAADLDYSAGANSLPVNSTPGAAISGVWQGRLEAPEPGYYNIIIETDAGAVVSVTLDGQLQPLTQNGAVWRNTNQLQLQAGTLYEVMLTVAKVKDTLSVRWETPKRPREVIPGRYLYAPTILASFSDVYIRFLKLGALASGLRLTANEIAHLATESAYQIDGDGWLNALAVSGAPTPAVAAALLPPFEALLNLARMKADLSANDEQVLIVLQDPATAAATPDGPLFALTNWDPASLSDLLVQFGITMPGLAQFDAFCRVYDAFAVIRPIGISGAALIRATTNAPDNAVASDFQGALRARHAAADWRNLIQPVNDVLRGDRRDALVAYILQQMRANSATAQIDTADKLFEYFLMDVQMEPCMLTSRIRHALSSIQLFIERCFMNLEPSVTLSSDAAKQWSWMKRYRVWEANRKVFLWPENWLEPELRDDKSPFFRELESELQQSDITEDSASVALLNYLAKLEEVAKLEPCGTYYVEPTADRDEVIHLVARTAGAHRKYYYRRYEFGYWLPWEPIKLDIEDTPIIPVIWKGRLLLFWLRLLRSGPDAAPPPPHRSLGSLSTDDLPGQRGIAVNAVLCWSEYYNNKWQAAKTSDLNRPTSLATIFSNRYDRSSLRLGATVEGDALRLHVNDAPVQFWRRGRTGNFEFCQIWPGSFLFYNTYSLPVCGEDDVVYLGVSTTTLPPQPPISLPGTSAPVPRRDFAGADSRDFAFRYVDESGASVTRDILRTQIPFEFISPRHELQNAWDAPVFFADSRHAFLVRTTERPVRARDFAGYGLLATAEVLQARQIQTLVLPTAPLQPISADAYIHLGLPDSGNVKYGDRVIGRAGALAEFRTER